MSQFGKLENSVIDITEIVYRMQLNPIYNVKSLIMDSVMLGFLMGKQNENIRDSLNKLMEIIKLLNQELMADSMTLQNKISIYNQCINQNSDLEETINFAKLNPIFEQQQEYEQNQSRIGSKQQSELEMPQKKQNSCIILQSAIMQSMIQSKLSIGASELKIDCNICYDGMKLRQLFPLANCEHLFHRDCLVQHCSAKINDNQIPLLCPEQNCKQEMCTTDLRELVSKQDWEKFDQFSFNQFIQANQELYVFCSTPGCGVLCEKGVGVPKFDCPNCKKSTCLQCRFAFHPGQNCEEFKMSMQFDPNDQKFVEFAQGKNFKQCSQCKFWVEKNQGCDHMTCKCGYQFCYVCGGQYGICECSRQQQQVNHQRGLSRLIQEIERVFFRG